MKILCLSPYHGGSHQAFFDSFESRSAHDIQIVSLAPRHFKWRMRSGSINIIKKAEAAGLLQQNWDLIFCSTLMNIAELRSFLPAQLRGVPIAAYFHENQVSYPSRVFQERDNHFAITNWLSAQAADRCVFNSRYNLDSFVAGTLQLLKKMPEKESAQSLQLIESKSKVISPGIDFDFFSKAVRTKSPVPTLGWCGRWEHDKNPEAYIATLDRLAGDGLEFSLIFLGQSFRTIPPELSAGLQRHDQRIIHAGFAESRDEYRALLGKIDYCISTARHEFFGLALLEAAAAGAQPVAPKRLVYPEIYPSAYLYEDTPDGLYEYLKPRLPRSNQKISIKPIDERENYALAEQFSLSKMCSDLDRELEDLVHS